MRQAGAQVVHGMKRLVQQREGKQAAGPSFGHNAASGALGGVPAQAHMLYIFAPALEIPRNDGRSEEDPCEIGPDMEPGDRTVKQAIKDGNERKLHPDPAAYLLILDEGVLAEKHSRKQNWREEKPRIQLDKGYKTPEPPGRVNLHEGPELFIASCRQVGMVRLVGDAIEREAHEAQGA